MTCSHVFAYCINYHKQIKKVRDVSFEEGKRAVKPQKTVLELKDRLKVISKTLWVVLSPEP